MMRFQRMRNYMQVWHLARKHGRETVGKQLGINFIINCDSFEELKLKSHRNSGWHEQIMYIKLALLVLAFPWLPHQILRLCKFRTKNIALNHYRGYTPNSIRRSSLSHSASEQPSRDAELRADLHASSMPFTKG